MFPVNSGSAFRNESQRESEELLHAKQCECISLIAESVFGLITLSVLAEGALGSACIYLILTLVADDCRSLAKKRVIYLSGTFLERLQVVGNDLFNLFSSGVEDTWILGRISRLIPSCH